MSNRPRILVVSSTFPRFTGDTEPAFVYDLCKYLVDNDIIIDVLAPHFPGLKRKEIMAGVNVYRYKYFIERFQVLAYSGGIMANLRRNPINYLLVPFFLVSQVFALQKKLKKNKYNAIHAHWIIPQGMVCVIVNTFFKAGSIPIICTLHGGDLYALNGFVMDRLKKWIMEKCRHICVVSESMGKRCQELGVVSTPVSIISMGVDLKTRFFPVPDVHRRRNRIIYVGRLVEKKGVKYLIDSIKIIRETLSDVELIIVGDGPLRQSLETQVNNLSLSSNIVFKGGLKQERLPALYSSAAISVLPSVIDSYGDQEGLGLTVIEAMGCECAVVASSLDAVKDIITDGKTGVFFEPGNADQLAEKIQALLSDDEARNIIAKSGRDYVVNRYDWSIIGEKYRTLLETVRASRSGDNLS